MFDLHFLVISTIIGEWQNIALHQGQSYARNIFDSEYAQIARQQL